MSDLDPGAVNACDPGGLRSTGVNFPASDGRAPEPLPMGIYIHWPYCLSKCPYCDFNSMVRMPCTPEQVADGLLRDFHLCADRIGSRTVSSVFFGGGTPSLMDSDWIAAILEAINERCVLIPDAEITLEANPTSVDIQGMAGFRKAGVNRISLGFQAMDDERLAILGRNHSVEEACRAFYSVRQHFDNINLDLIHSTPGQDGGGWKLELERAAELGPSHISAYALMIEPGTPFFRMARQGQLKPLDDVPALRLLELTYEVLEMLGFSAVEISSFSRPEMACRHNLTYWRCGDYLGLGPGAHGRVTLKGQRIATFNSKSVSAWYQGGKGTDQRTVLSDSDRWTEHMVMGLRLREGINASLLENRPGDDREQQQSCEQALMLLDEGYLQRSSCGTRISVPVRHWPVLDAVIRQVCA